MPRRVLGIAALGTEPDAVLVGKAETFVEGVSSRCPGTVLALGGYWGLMRRVVDFAIRRGLLVLVFPPVEAENLEFPDSVVVVKTGLSYRLRSVALVKTSDVLVALGGEAGTIQEVVTAYTEKKPVLVLAGTGLSTDRLEMLGEYVDARKTSRLEFYTDPSALARRACELLYPKDLSPASPSPGTM